MSAARRGSLRESERERHQWRQRGSGQIAANRRIALQTVYSTRGQAERKLGRVSLMFKSAETITTILSALLASAVAARTLARRRRGQEAE